MYREFFGLKENPFSVTSDPSFLFLSRVHKEAFSHIIYGIKERKGFLEITGEIGAGKTTICRALLNALDKDTKSAIVLNPSLSGLQLLQTIVEDFGLEVGKKTKASLIKQLNAFLLDELSKGNNVILVIDEAQNLKSSTLEDIRMLSNLETEKEKLFQIILVGQPELRKKLNSPELTQLKQRIGVRFHLTPLQTDEIADYITHRLSVAGSDGSIRFTDDALIEINRFSNGVPRLINMVCDRALLLAYVMETKDITAPIITRSIKEIHGVTSI